MPAVQFHQPSDDREADAESAVTPRDGCVGLTETVEDARQCLGADADARIADEKFHTGRARATDTEFDRPAVGREYLRDAQ